MSAEMVDLIERLERAKRELTEMSVAAVAAPSTRKRLEAKASGVALALSYAREYERLSPASDWCGCRAYTSPHPHNPWRRIYEGAPCPEVRVDALTPPP